MGGDISLPTLTNRYYAGLAALSRISRTNEIGGYRIGVVPSVILNKFYGTVMRIYFASTGKKRDNRAGW